MSAMNQIGFDRQVLIDEIGAVSIVRVNASYLGGSDKNILRLFCPKEFTYR